MKKEFWIEKWQNNQTGFHKDEAHPLLVKYIDKLQLNAGDSIFVPLCGKSVDLLWLNNQGFKVLGIELSELAVEQFFNENNLPYTLTQSHIYSIYQWENICIYQGDFFDLTKEDCQEINAIYDRAALIALPDNLANKYVNKMHELVSKGTKELLVTLELERSNEALGPPFSVNPDKVADLFSDFNTVELLQTEDIIKREKGFQKQGCEFVYERVFLVIK